MKIFKKANWDNHTCPMCKTKDDKEVILVPIVGTKNGNNYEATPIHVDCIADRLMYYPDDNIIAGVGDE